MLCSFHWPFSFVIHCQQLQVFQNSQSSRFNLTQPRMLPNLIVNNMFFGIVFLFNGNFQGILCRQNTGRSCKLCPSLHGGPSPFFMCARLSPTLGPLHLLLPLPGKFFSSQFTPWLPLDLPSNVIYSWGLPWPTLTLDHPLWFPLCTLFLSTAHIPLSHILWIAQLFIVCCPLEWSSMQVASFVCLFSHHLEQCPAHHRWL